jgi:hypothetical protein
MNLYQCQEKAKDVGFDKARFFAMFPAGPVECQWFDAYMGLFKVDVDGLRDGFLTVKQIDEQYPGLMVTKPFVDEAD